MAAVTGSTPASDAGGALGQHCGPILAAAPWAPIAAAPDLLRPMSGPLQVTFRRDFKAKEHTLHAAAEICDTIATAAKAEKEVAEKAEERGRLTQQALAEQAAAGEAAEEAKEETKTEAAKVSVAKVDAEALEVADEAAAEDAEKAAQALASKKHATADAVTAVVLSG